MRNIRLIIFLASLLISLPSSAQFYQIGDDKGGLKWMQTETEHYRLIYPEGLDSLSTAYIQQLEKYWGCVGNSAGYHPGEFYCKKTPVILHSYHGISNGSVAVAPMRMDLFSLPQAYQPGPMPWDQSLAVHESRHVSQMQFGRDHALKPFNWFLGQMFSGAMSAIYPNTHLLEGDAVVTETALTPYGRGREAEFLNFYRTAFDNGDWRSWYKWRYGSYKHYAPNHYALGYLTIAGTRYCYDDPLFMKEYFQSAARQPYKLMHMQRTVRKASGKSFKDSFNEICHTFHDQWKEEQEARAPFIVSEALQETPDWFTEYSEICLGEQETYALKTGKVETRELVRIDQKGKEKTLRQFSYHAGGLYLTEDRLWWSESIPHPRWDLVMNSQIRSMDLKSGRIRKLTRKGRYFNPCPSPDRNSVAVTEYRANGENRITLLDTRNGSVLDSYRCPDGMQPVECAWLDDSLIFTAITSEGTGIYQPGRGQIEPLIPPQAVSISDLKSLHGKIYFSSDRTGANEFYRMDPKTGEIYQLTSLKQGGKDFCIHPQDESICYTQLDGKGRLLYRSSKKQLKEERISFSDTHEYKIAERLADQERTYAEEKGIVWPDSIDFRKIRTSQPKPYRKGLKMFNFHSWAPLYADADRIQQLSFDRIPTNAFGLGATAFFQSHLGDAAGSIGYLYGRTGLDNSYRSSLHLSYTYSGWYPVIEAKMHFGERKPLQYCRKQYIKGPLSMRSLGAYEKDGPSFIGSLRTYIPFDLSSSGWSRGVIPSATWNFSNDSFNRSTVLLDQSGSMTEASFNQFVGQEADKNLFMQVLDLSLRAYTMQYISPASAFPKYGISAEIGWHGRLGLTDLYTSALYAYTYGYLPGIRSNHGLRLSAKMQHQFKTDGMIGENRINMAPRGLADAGIQQFFSSYSPDQFSASVEYSLPIYIGDLDFLCPVLYIKNLELRPFADYSYMNMVEGMCKGDLYSIGSELTVHSANLLWLPYDTSIGISACCNGGSMMKTLKGYGFKPKNYHIGFVFRISM